MCRHQRSGCECGQRDVHRPAAARLRGERTRRADRSDGLGAVQCHRGAPLSSPSSRYFLRIESNAALLLCAQVKELIAKSHDDATLNAGSPLGRFCEFFNSLGFWASTQVLQPGLDMAQREKLLLKFFKVIRVRSVSFLSSVISSSSLRSSTLLWLCAH